VGFVGDEGADWLYVRFKNFASLGGAFSLSCGPFRTVMSLPLQLTATIPALKREIIVSTPGIPSRCVDSQRCPKHALGRVPRRNQKLSGYPSRLYMMLIFSRPARPDFSLWRW
jgi:hypothetical protein